MKEVQLTKHLTINDNGEIYKEMGKTNVSQKEIVKEIVWKMRHDGKFRFESETDWADFAEK